MGNLGKTMENMIFVGLNWVDKWLNSMVYGRYNKLVTGVYKLLSTNL